MNEKIQKMITELALECRKEDVTLSLAAIDETGLCSVARFGNNQGIESAIVAQIAHWEQSVKEYNCSNCKKLATAMQEDEEAEDLSAAVKDFTDKLAAFFRGDLT